ncbi:gluconate 2-dehydrogenase subunit 3 family protein [Pedobacter heparinus]|uniref:Twin-arginine translocation pathway signal n=1 Tax=Pedobacter heparinus (strain ATCC 13125 / DSM 2366 / CIP 104194 / JCM 7457 / NBRC 12017 / NCIMB 9290 / NRRL B-14731 / HIM 762-3) TaxID=485917 RepID=C6XW95_PEDHD|nr:gluconate 2-dehydrogenase subunit 3 family protein [Pedobacter heparinus]ACU04174.1 twin-arginine translocation pathway signal [Pedobacter heparinus DSM 2366]
MNRRSYLKGIVFLGAASVVTYFAGIKKYFNRAQDIGHIKDKEPILAELVDLIIPATESPGAKDALVHLYIIKILTNCHTKALQNEFLAGIADLEKKAISNYNKDFLKCTLPEKMAVLDLFARKSGYNSAILNKIIKKIFGESFFPMLKRLTVEGYCLSKPGATQGLEYDYIPGAFYACVPLKKGQKSWATK